MIEVRNIIYAALLLAAVLIGHYTTIAGRSENVHCFAPLELEK